MLAFLALFHSDSTCVCPWNLLVIGSRESLPWWSIKPLNKCFFYVCELPACLPSGSNYILVPWQWKVACDSLWDSKTQPVDVCIFWEPQSQNWRDDFRRWFKYSHNLLSKPGPFKSETICYWKLHQDYRYFVGHLVFSVKNSWFYYWAPTVC